MVTPPLLHPGSTVALLSPASAIDASLIDGAAEALRAEGFEPLVMPGAKGRAGSFSAPAAQRLSDLQDAINNPRVGAIICGRGGYGAVHLIDRIELKRPVWLAGFSDISALHALWLSRGIRSVHSSMAKELTRSLCPDNEANRRLFEIIRTGRMPDIGFAPHPLNRPGCATGILRGGNLAVLQALISTPYNLLLPGSILVIEDIAEPIYKVERFIMQLRLSGLLNSLRGLIVGQFTEWRPSADWQDMNEMIASAVGPVPFPVAFNAPIGHIDGNLPFIEGAEVELTIDSDGSKISQI